MKNHKIMYLISATLVFGLSGCTTLRLSPDNPISLQNRTKADTMQSCEEVLTKMRFVIEKYDVEQGFITTKPLRGGQFFEPWRRDNIGAANAKTANMHSILRTATLNISEDAGSVNVACDVQVRRLSIPEKELSSFRHVSESFTGGDVSMQRLAITSDEAEWIPMEPDRILAKQILGTIKHKATGK